MFSFINLMCVVVKNSIKINCISIESKRAVGWRESAQQQTRTQEPKHKNTHARMQAGT